MKTNKKMNIYFCWTPVQNSKIFNLLLHETKKIATCILLVAIA